MMILLIMLLQQTKIMNLMLAGCQGSGVHRLRLAVIGRVRVLVRRPQTVHDGGRCGGSDRLLNAEYLLKLLFVHIGMF